MKNIFPEGFSFIIVGFLIGALFTLIIIRYGNTIANKAITAVNDLMPKEYRTRLVQKASGIMNLLGDKIEFI